METTKEQRNRMILDNMGLVYHIAKQTRPELPLEDKAQEGALGLVRAIERFEPERGFKFGTYASWWIRQAIERMHGQYRRGLKLPVHALSSMRSMKMATRQLHAILRRPPTLEEVARASGIPMKKARLLDNLRRQPTGLEILHPFVAEQATAPWEGRRNSLEEDVALEELPGLLGELLGSLKPRERFIVARRVGLGGGPMTLSQVGQVLGITRERVRQIFNKAIERLRRNARQEGFEVFL